MNRKILSLLGIARRAGKISFGFEAVSSEIKQQKAKLVLIASDISDKTKKEIEFVAKQTVPVIYTDFSICELSSAIGIKAGIISLNDEGFSNRIQQLNQHSLQGDN